MHNDYLEILSNVGLIGYIFLFWLVFLIVKRMWFILTNTENKDRILAMGIALGAIGFGIVAMFSYPVHTYLPAIFITNLFWIVRVKFYS